MIEQYLWIAGSLPFIILGAIHLLYTFFTDKFSSRNKSVDEAMKTSHPVITRKITMWKAWIGFNASHSSGVMYIGIVNLLCAVLYPAILYQPVFLIINMVTVLFYLWLAKKYWFHIPFTGVLISLCCFIVAVVVIVFR